MRIKKGDTMIETLELRSILNNALIRQEREIRKARKKKEPIEKLWGYIKPGRFEDLICEISHKGLLSELQDLLDDWDKVKIWDNISDFYLVRILEDNYPTNHIPILQEMSSERIEQFLNSGYCRYSFVFNMTNISDNVGMLKMISLSSLERAFRETLGLLCGVLARIVHGEVDMDDENEIFRKIAQLPAGTVASILEESDVLVVSKLLEKMTPEDMAEVQQKIRAKELYNVVEKSNYLILDLGAVERLSKEERIKAFTFLKAQNVRLTDFFRREDIIKYIYPIISLEEKEYILHDVLIKDELITLYESLSEADRQEMLLIMVGQKVSGHCEAARIEEMRENAIFVLEEKDGELSYIEKLVLDDLNLRVD